MNNPLHFITELLKRPIYEVAWVFYMMAINLGAIFFWEELLAKIIIIVFMASSMLMMGLYSKFGFTRILGLGHILWFPLAIYIGLELGTADGIYLTYLIVLLVTISISLVIDTLDVSRYLKGEIAFE